MIRFVSGEIRIDGFDYPQDTTQFDIRHGRSQQHGAGPERLAVTAPLVEAIAGLVREWNREASRIRAQSQRAAALESQIVAATGTDHGRFSVKIQTDPEPGLKGERYAING